MTRYLKLEQRKNSIFSQANLMTRERAMNAEINNVVGSMLLARCGGGAIMVGCRYCFDEGRIAVL